MAGPVNDVSTNSQISSSWFALHKQGPTNLAFEDQHLHLQSSIAFERPSVNFYDNLHPVKCLKNLGKSLLRLFKYRNY